MNKFKVGDKVIINQKQDTSKLFEGFYNQELEVYKTGFNTYNEQTVKVKSLSTSNTTHGHHDFFKLSPQIGNKVKILSKGVDGDLESDYSSCIGVIQNVSYLDKYSYRVLIDNFFDIFVEDVEIVEFQINISELLSISDEAKYQIGEINNNYVNEVMSTHYNNIDKVEKNLKSIEDLENETIIENSMVNHPQHYQSSKIEVIDIIDEFNLDFALGNVVKYILRSEKKGKQLEDLQKAAWYLNHKIKKLENEKRFK